LYFAKTWFSFQSGRWCFIAACHSPRRHSSYSTTLCRGATQAGPAIQPTPPIIITQAGMCDEAANTSIRPSTRSRIESSRPVFDEASLR
jgi:hypothetical protein